MVEHYIKPLYDKIFIMPVARHIHNTTNQHPILLTCISCITGIIAAIFIALNFPIMACLFLLLSGYLDSLDGAYARLTSKTSQKGAVLDIISDRIVELAIVIGLYLLHPEIRDLAIVLMLGSMFLCITSFLVVGIFNQNDGQKSFHYSPGIIERPETFLFFIAMIFLPQFFSLLAFIFVCLVLLTAFVRLRQFFK